MTGLRLSSVFFRRASSIVREHFQCRISSSETSYWIFTKNHMNDPSVVPTKMVQSVSIGGIGRSPDDFQFFLLGHKSGTGRRLYMIPSAVRRRGRRF